MCQIADSSELRQHLLEMGIIPDVLIQLEWMSLVDNRTSIRLQGFQISLSREEAESVLVFRCSPDICRCGRPGIRRPPRCSCTWSDIGDDQLF